MLKRLIILGLTLFIGASFASEPKLKDYDEYQIPSGYHIPIISLQEFSTAITEEGEKLKDKAVSVSDVAVAVGFKDVAYFYRVFSKKYGTTPKKYRDSVDD